MNFRFLSFFTVLLTASVLFAQEKPAVALQHIEAALEDQLYPLAEKQAKEALAASPSPEEEADFRLLLVRALAAQKKYDDALTVIDNGKELPKQDAFIYWRGRVLFEAKRYPEVFQTLENLPADSSYTPDALRLRGRAGQASGNLQAAYKAYEMFYRLFPNDTNAIQNMIDLADVYIDRKDDGFAIQVLRSLLSNSPKGPEPDSARLKLARLLVKGGNTNNTEEASVLLKILGESQTAAPGKRVVAWTELAALQQKSGNAAAAADSLKNAEALTDEASQKAKQQAVRAALLIKEGKTEEAFKLFDQALAVSLDNETSATVLNFKAEALLESKQYAKAEKAFQACLDVAKDRATQAQALAGKGWSLREQKRYEEAAVSFENAADKCSNEEHCVAVLLAAGDARMSAKQYDKAYEDYRRITKKYPDQPQAAHAMYQCGMAALLAKRTEEARLHFVETETDFPDSEFAAQSALRLAQILNDEQQWDRALAEYKRITGRYKNPSILATAFHQQGLILYRTGKPAEALEAFRTVAENYPDSPEAAQAYYMEGFCYYLQGETEKALSICSSFSEKFPGSQWTPDVLFWLAEHYYNHGEYKKAQTYFLDIATRFPKNELADDALLWAGNALLRQDSFLDAFNTYSRLAKEYPKSPLMLQTRFAQGEALTELGEFARAILAYEEVIKAAPDDPLSDRARGRLADCQFTLGSSDPERYQKALSAYQDLYKRPGLSFELKLQSLYKIAKTEKKLGKDEDAFSHCMDAVYSGLGQKEPLSPDAVLWFTRAAFDAAAFQEQQENWKEAVNIYQRIVESGVPAQEEAQKRIEKIKREHPAVF